MIKLYNSDILKFWTKHDIKFTQDFLLIFLVLSSTVSIKYIDEIL